MLFVLLMKRRPPRAHRTATRFPYTTLSRAAARLRPAGRSGRAAAVRGRGGGGAAQGLGRGVAAGGQPLASGFDAMPWWLPAAVALALVAAEIGRAHV